MLTVYILSIGMQCSMSMSLLLLPPPWRGRTYLLAETLYCCTLHAAQLSAESWLYPPVRQEIVSRGKKSAGNTRGNTLLEKWHHLTLGGLRVGCETFYNSNSWCFYKYIFIHKSQNIGSKNDGKWSKIECPLRPQWVGCKISKSSRAYVQLDSCRN